MVKTHIYKCPNCGTITIVNVNQWGERCGVCNVPMVKLDEEFDLLEIATCECENGAVEQ